MGRPSKLTSHQQREAGDALTDIARTYGAHDDRLALSARGHWWKCSSSAAMTYLARTS
jgi:hypothetical protein